MWLTVQVDALEDVQLIIDTGSQRVPEWRFQWIESARAFNLPWVTVVNEERQPRFVVRRKQ